MDYGLHRRGNSGGLVREVLCEIGWQKMKKKIVIAFFTFAALFILITGFVHDIASGEPVKDERQAESVACSAPVEQLTDEPDSEDPQESEKIDAALDWHYIEDVTLTAYCSCTQCCGEYALDRPNGIVYTASGAEAQSNYTIAVDPDVIPLGAWVEIDGNLYHAEDTGAFSGSHVDIYFGNHSDTLKFGVKHENIRWMHDDF